MQKTELAQIKTELKALHKDLNNCAAKDDLKNFVTNDRFDKLIKIVLKNSQDIEIIKETMATKDDIRTVLDRIDTFTKKSDVFDKKAIVHDYRLNELEPKVLEHERRLAALEATKH